jgi:hypothetical protein
VDRACQPGPGLEAFWVSEAEIVTAGLGDEHLRGDKPVPGIVWSNSSCRAQGSMRNQSSASNAAVARSVEADRFSSCPTIIA